MADISKDVLIKFRDGNESAYRVIFLKYNQKVHLYISKIIRSRDQAEDLTQDVFIRLWEGRHTIDVNRDISSFIFVVAKNRAFDFLRAKNPKIKYESEKIHLGEDFNTQEDETFDNYVELMMQLLLDKLPKKQRAIFELSQEGQSNEQIANSLNISTRTVDNNLSLTRAAMKSAMYILLIFIV